MKNKGNLIIYLLVIVLSVQVYIMFFRDPAVMVKEGLVEKKFDLQVLFQGRDPGVPAPVPGKEPEIDDKVTVQRLGPEARPVVVPGVSHGEGQKVPKAPKSAIQKRPTVPGGPKSFDLKLSLDGNDDFYLVMVYGVLILENEKDLALTPEQSHKLKQLFDMKNKVKEAVPTAQTTIYETLTDEQLKYIYVQKCRKQGGSRPLAPEFLDENAVQIRKLLEKRLKELN